MEFLWPTMLIFVALAPVLAALYLRLQRRRERAVAGFGLAGAQVGAAARALGWRRHLPMILFLAGLTVLLVALARPQTTVHLPSREGIVILAFDVSGSMAAEDMLPNRMEAAKLAVQDFVQRQPESVKIGVLAFSDSGLSVQNPTHEQATVLTAISRLSPQRGTSLGNGILAALNIIELERNPPQEPLQYSERTPEATPTFTPVPRGTYIPAVIILVTDGENNEAPDPLAVAQLAAERGVRVYTVGIGSAAGTTLEIEGFTVHTQLNEPLLQEIAAITGGTYAHAETAADLQAVYANLNPALVLKPEKMEVTSLFSGAGVLLLLLGGALSLAWFARLP